MAAAGPTFDPAQRGALRRMQMVATGLLGVSLATLGIATYFQPRYPALAYLAAFAEAATIGGMADWYAVVALFRRPLGLPIPHTAILPASQDRIAESLGEFIETQFLRADAVRAKLGETDFAGMMVEWLSDPQRAGALATYAVKALPQLLESADSSHAKSFVATQVQQAARKANISPYAANLVDGLLATGRHQQVFTDILGVLGRLMLEPRAIQSVWEKIQGELPKVLRLVGADGFLLRKILIAAAEFLDEVQQRPDHPIRGEVDAAIRRFVDDLRQSPDFQRKVDDFKNTLIDRPETAALLEVAWQSLKTYVARDVAAETSAIRGHLRDVLMSAARQLRDDAALKAEINAGMVAALASFIEQQKSGVSRFISQQVKGWDMTHMTDIVEEKIGRDLQYIRFNGTLIGGLIGLILYSVLHAAGLR